MISFIKAIEYARLYNLKKALQEINRSSNGINNQRKALEIIQQMLADYYEYNNEPIQKLYEKILNLKVNIPIISKRKIPTKVEEFITGKNIRN